MEPRISYEELLVTYERSLMTKLRGFHSLKEFEFLETWVPDDDHTRSLLNLVESAKEGGLEGFSLHIGAGILEKIDLARLIKEAAPLARIEVERTQQGAELRFHVEEAKALPIHPAYQQGIQQLLAAARYDGVLEEEAGLIRAESQWQGVTLQALVNPSKQHTIERVAYLGTPSALHKGLLEGLCQILQGRPIQEGSDHAVLRLENRLRDPRMAPPVEGVVTFRNADPVFDLPLRLVRGLFDAYQKKSGFQPVRNFYDETISDSWRGLSQEEKRSHLAEAIAMHPSGDQVELIRIEADQRVVICFRQTLEGSVKQRRIFALEEHLKKTVEPTLQVSLQPKMDENKPRQGKGVGL